MSEPDDPPPRGLTPREVPDEQQVAPDLLRAIEQMVDDVANRPFSRDLSERLESLVELLILRGHLAASHRRLLARVKGRDTSTVRLSVFSDKRAVPSSDVDCPSLLHLCKGRCCAMDVSLSAEDLAEGTLRWELHQPYLLRRDPVHGYCSYLDDRGRCQVYDERPGTCRAYDCRKDPRVWIDFEQRIPAPMPSYLVPPDARAGQPADDDRRDPSGEPDDQGGASGGGAGPTTSAG